MAWLLANPGVGGIRNVGTGEARSFNELGRAVFQAMGRACNIEYIDMPASLARNYQSHTCADMGWLSRLRCPVQFRRLEAGVTDYVRNHLESADPML